MSATKIKRRIDEAERQAEALMITCRLLAIDVKHTKHGKKALKIRHAAEKMHGIICDFRHKIIVRSH